MSYDFAKAVTKKVSEIERPPLIPIGTYHAVSTKNPGIETLSGGVWDVLDFTLRLVTPTEDVNADDLRTYGGLTPVSTIRHRFMFNREDEAAGKRTEFNLRRFLQDHLKVAMEPHTSLAEALNNSINHSCLVTIKWRADKNDPEVMYAEVNRTAAVE